MWGTCVRTLSFITRDRFTDINANQLPFSRFTTTNQSTNLSAHPFTADSTCITYDAVNAAYLDARKRIHISQPKGDWKTEDIATVGELLLDISIQLARRVSLKGVIVTFLWSLIVMIL
uniref:Uncharacterized protein n=1 Tax=Glossina brevipalpis TaxID=37001 RepID=A0A1A9WNR8_9MUSC